MATQGAADRRRLLLLLAVGLLVFLLAFFLAWSVRKPTRKQRGAQVVMATTDEPVNRSPLAHAPVPKQAPASPDHAQPAILAEPAARSPGGPPPGYASTADGDNPSGIRAEPITYDTDPAKRRRIPPGGFDAWTGEEGTYPGQLEIYAKSENTTLELIRAMRRLHWLTGLSRNWNLLMELRGSPPGQDVEAALAALAKAAWSDGGKIYQQAGAGELQPDDGVRQLEAVIEKYRSDYLETAGVTKQQFDAFFQPDQYLP